MENSLVVNGRRVKWYVHGPVPTPGITPLVLLHGFCEDASVWMFVLRAMRMDPTLLGDHNANPQRTIIVLDLPGFGASETPLTSGMEVYADAVCAVLNELNVSKVAMAGHSMGGYTHLLLPSKYPERLAGISLVHSHPFADNEERKANRRRGIELLQNGKKEAYCKSTGPRTFSRILPQQTP